MAVLHYFEGRGKGEIVRLMLCAAEVQFTESFVKTREQFLKLVEDGKLVFKQLPMLEMDGQYLVQTNAILRYIAEKSGMKPKSLLDSYRVDMLYEASRDIQIAFLPIGFRSKEEILKSAEETTLPKWLPIFEKELENSKNGYLVGDSITLADAGLLEALLSSLDYFGDQVFKNYPNIQKFVDHMKSKERIQHYLNNVRQRPNDEKYIREVQTSLGRIF